ncbi:MAG: hypothetical protein JXB62_19760 [Pirellulales bacterium]|nr:hypothetical protein [Pirellulales bacterium]
MTNRHHRLSTLLSLLGAGWLCALAAGCSEEINPTYGRRNAEGGSVSINGTSVLGSMFEQAGHRVFSWRKLSPKVSRRADCIVWFPNDFEPPDPEARAWLDTWLTEQPGRTLIYVGRDFDANGFYWEKVEPDAPPRQVPKIRARRNAARRQFRRARPAMPEPEDCEWFTADGKYEPRKVRTLTDGDPRWLDGIDPEKLEIELNGRIDPGPTAEVLLESEGDVLVSRECSWGPLDPWGQGDQGKLIVVANGSFLLNLPLVNHEHRKLAGKLIEEVGPPRKTVVFLESNAGEQLVLEEDPSAARPTGLEILTTSPACWIFLHLAVVGLFFCFSRWPIFGLPRKLPRGSPSDFGKHIQALAELLERSRDQAYAVTRLLHYQQTVKTKSDDSNP